MSKISYSGFVNTIRGKLSGTVLSSCKGVNYLKLHNPSPRQPHSISQQKTRGILNELSGIWYSLPRVNKDLWESFASMHSKTMSGINAHNSLNLALVYYLGPTARITTPPPSPSTPPFPRNFSVSYLSDGDFCIFWTSPSLTTITIIVNYWPMPGRQDSSICRWKLGNTSGSDSLHCTVSTGLSSDFILKFRVRTMDNYGRLSPWSYQQSSLLIFPGIFGYTPFGWSYFGPAA